jgi:hypothetical protein
MQPPRKDMKNFASMCDGIGEGTKSPVTVKSKSPFVLLLMLMVLVRADYFPNIF